MFSEGKAPACPPCCRTRPSLRWPCAQRRASVCHEAGRGVFTGRLDPGSCKHGIPGARPQVRAEGHAVVLGFSREKLAEMSCP